MSSLTTHLCFRLARVSRSVMAHYERKCRDMGLTPIQMLVLGTLQERNAATVGELAEELGFDQTTMTRILQRMVSARLIEHLPDPGDRRIRRVYLHRESKKLLKKWMATAEDLETELTTRLTEAERQALIPILEKLQS